MSRYESSYNPETCTINADLASIKSTIDSVIQVGKNPTPESIDACHEMIMSLEESGKHSIFQFDPQSSSLDSPKQNCKKVTTVDYTTLFPENQNAMEQFTLGLFYIASKLYPDFTTYRSQPLPSSSPHGTKRKADDTDGWQSQAERYYHHANKILNKICNVFLVSPSEAGFIGVSGNVMLYLGEKKDTEKYNVTTMTDASYKYWKFALSPPMLHFFQAWLKWFMTDKMKSVFLPQCERGLTKVADACMSMPEDLEYDEAIEDSEQTLVTLIKIDKDQDPSDAYEENAVTVNLNFLKGQPGETEISFVYRGTSLQFSD